MSSRGDDEAKAPVIELVPASKCPLWVTSGHQAVAYLVRFTPERLPRGIAHRRCARTSRIDRPAPECFLRNVEPRPCLSRTEHLHGIGETSPSRCQFKRSETGYRAFLFAGFSKRALSSVTAVQSLLLRATPHYRAAIVATISSVLTMAPA